MVDDKGAYSDAASPAFDPFRRLDRYGVMGKAGQPPAEVARRRFFAIFVFPLRALLVIASVVSMYVVCCIASFLPPERRQSLEATLGRLLSRVCLFACGFLYIDWRELGGEKQDDKEKFAGIVSNHVSWVDILLHMSRSFPSFVAKAGTRQLPLVGLISERLGCMYVKRENKVKGEVGVSGQVKKRMQAFYEKGSLPRRMLLFPEATTSNGDYMLPFKTGAFLAGVPVQPTIIKYSSDWVSPAWETIKGLHHIYLLMTSPWHSVTVYVLPVYHPSEEEQNDPELFANNVRDSMLKFSGLKSTQSTYEDKKRYHALIEASMEPKAA